MKALVLVAHGSRRQASNEEVQRLGDRLSLLTSREFGLVQTGFLELARPSIPEAIESTIHAGATTVVVVPYFLAAGRHVTEDIPAILSPLMEKFPGVRFDIGEHIGMSALMSMLILESANNPTHTNFIPEPRRTA